MFGDAFGRRTWRTVRRPGAGPESTFGDQGQTPDVTPSVATTHPTEDGSSSGGGTGTWTSGTGRPPGAFVARSPDAADSMP